MKLRITINRNGRNKEEKTKLRYGWVNDWCEVHELIHAVRNGWAWCVIAFDDLCKRFEYGKDFVQVAYVHDECQYSVNPVIATEFVQIVEAAALKAGDALGHRVPITAKGDVGNNWSDTH